MCKTLAIRVRGGVYMIPLEEIVYLENRLRKIRVCMPGKEIEFLRCSRSFILNKDHIRAMRQCGQYEIIMDNGDHLSFSKKLFLRAKNDFDAYLRAKMR